MLIVGGGPAGSTCAWALRRAGFSVAVWDRKQFPRDKICAGWITPQVLADLDLDPSAYLDGHRTFQPIAGFRLSRLGDPDVCVRYSAPASYAIRRSEFDDFLLRRSGADLYLGEPVRDLRREAGQWVIGDAVRAPMLVGAGGHFCPVAQMLGAKLGAGEPIIAAQESEFELNAEQQHSCTVEPDLPELFFTRDLKGYGWAVRKGRHLNVGLGREGNQNLSHHVEEFLAFLAARGKAPANLPKKPCGHPYLLHGMHGRPLVGESALLVGDAGGLAYPRSGEGIRPAIESALLAAQTILEAGGRYDRDRLAPYEQRLVARFGARRPTRGITDVLPDGIAISIAARLLRTAWFARHVVLDRWFFHADQAPLRVDLRRGEAQRNADER